MGTFYDKYDDNGRLVSTRCRVILGRDRRGKQIFASKTFKVSSDLTPAKAVKDVRVQAQTWEKTVKDDFARGNNPSQRTNFKEFAEDDFWNGFVVDGKHRPSTVEYYKNMISVLVDYFGKKQLAKITVREINQFFVYLRVSKELSEASIRHYRSALRKMYNFAVQNRIINRADNPMPDTDVITVENKPVEFLSPDEVSRFIAKLDDLDTVDENGVTQRSIWRCIMYLLLYTGMRRGEAVGLTWNDIDFKNGIIHIRRSACYVPKPKDSEKRKLVEGKDYGVIISKPKTDKSVRDVALNPHLAKIMLDWKKQEEADAGGKLFPKAYVFPASDDFYAPIHPCSVYTWLVRFCKENKLPRMYPHELRHTFGSLMVRSGATIKQVQDSMGHTKPITTLQFYAGTTQDEIQCAMNNYADKFLVPGKDRNGTENT